MSAASAPSQARARTPAPEPVDQRQLRTVVLASLLGTTVEWYDFFLYSTAAGLVFNKLFFPTADGTVGTMLSFATFAVGFVARPVGGLLFGHIGDRLGRKRTLAFTMSMMGLSTALIGLLPTYDQVGIVAPALLLVLRVAQGVALGGEWAGAVLLAVEYGPQGRKGRFGSYPQIGLALGLALGTGVFALLSDALSEAAFVDYGWRIAFLVSLVLVVVGLTVRLRIEETPAFRAVRRLQELPRSAPLVELVREPVARRHLLLGMLARWGEGAAFNTWGVFAITYATDTLHLHRTPVLLAVTAAALVMAVLIPVSGAAVDRRGARSVYGAGMTAFACSVFPAFWLFGTGGAAAFAAALVVALGIVHAWFYGAQGTLFAALFATPVRYTGMSFVYQVSGIFASGITPLIMTALLAAGSGSPWWACGYLALTGLVSVWATNRLRTEDLHMATGAPAAASDAPAPAAVRG
ncbi:MULTISPECIES: MFS transporter [Streptomyces]|uniref:MFS transporter n=1 Tax=Streptomyces TaxID=1883 RepID=UPI000F74AAF0|nr:MULTISPECIES: MFS transporter [Streptomyces]MCM3265060.1 MHS family MFS transporter [Streptomyces thermoviolaceus]RSS03968.1 MFS transporter [Streptomyces sp. WAC00469]WTD50672.1 MHS family MFS transporter [Streptomyces thermoviolaceus]GGV76338.1 MFS transporter [Streptomyces thermoviolaceus subsp. apingens]